MIFLIIVIAFFGLVIYKAYLNSDYKKAKEAKKQKNEVESTILMESVKEIDGRYLVELEYKVANARFPVSKKAITDNEKEAYEILESFKNEYRQKTIQMQSSQETNTMNLDNAEKNKSGLYVAIVLFVMQFMLNFILNTIGSGATSGMAYTIGNMIIPAIIVILLYKKVIKKKGTIILTCLLIASSVGKVLTGEEDIITLTIYTLFYCAPFIIGLYFFYIYVNGKD